MNRNIAMDKKWNRIAMYVTVYIVTMLVWGAALIGMMFKSMAGNALLVSVGSIALMVAILIALLWFWMDTKLTLDALNEVHEEVLGAVSPETASYLLKLWKKSGVLNIRAGSARHLNDQPEDYPHE